MHACKGIIYMFIHHEDRIGLQQRLKQTDRQTNTTTNTSISRLAFSLFVTINIFYGYHLLTLETKHPYTIEYIY